MDIFKQRYGSEYTPLVGEEHSKYRIVIPFNKLAWFTVGLPFFGFLFCIIWSITYNFEAATSTHCQVYNVLPSISAAIGHFEPQKNVWKLAIALQAIIRSFIFYMYYQYYHQTIYKWAQGVINLALFTYAIENISLFTLSFWTSNENYALHKVSFITFLITSFIHMIVVCYMGKYCRSTMKDSSEIKAYTIKTRAMLLNVISILSACYFFWKHNKYCEPLVYSLFALSEYMVVLTNMLFHLTAAWDFAGRKILISLRGIRVI
ncbi:post-GPI attachment to proteins factor 2-like [Chelonus insularis]|uniref:post-GPI attachment to proteins factor 2-like n=1 Tax=Chelonus insularis TaxID=460826 RepID=UPI001588385C|nr:post-GPI attachment to proteins factor 2-like [Chelonus insularis]